MYDFKELKNKIEETEAWLIKEFSSVRTGSAATSLLDNVRVDSYGSKVPVNQVGNVTTEDARTIRVTPWDVGQIKDIEAAITQADLGVSVSVDEKGVRVIFPALTEETRTNILKVAKGKLEEARISLRGSRDDIWNDLQTKHKNGDIGEDVKFTAKEEMEKYVKDANSKFDEMYDRKEKEIMN